ncbi:hypothetical protein POL68_04110 [Stigmatella sp. ncwal1]|uniref:Lipoprotein n=1 Tax=Stigmatella ashevillensis TaxID=2995309 RepID=A0ABT5D3J3_9BACT|nr:hypothetical protein [Stigmatella ashevillena]MDC0707645.1 hypothetical protein [Stigmatella ashevillena]
MTRCSILFLLVCLSACTSTRLSGSNLDRVARPAFVSRIEVEAGPKSLVFREDNTYSEKLKKLEPKEADRRLQAKLAAAVTRFEISERLRVNTLHQLPRERPWTSVLDPARVATALESFLVEEVPANAPDYDLLVPLGADAIVEFVVQDYGMHSEKGRAGAYIKGYGRMFWLDGRNEVWRRPFDADQLQMDAEHLDPFKVGKNPELFQRAITSLVDAISAQFTKDLTPKDRRGGATLPEAAEQSAPDSTHRTGRENQRPPAPPAPELAPGELPDPDP